MSNEPGRMQQTQPEYGTYNTAGVPISQLRKMQLSDDDRALMDKFKNQGNFLTLFTTIPRAVTDNQSNTPIPF